VLAGRQRRHVRGGASPRVLYGCAGGVALFHQHCETQARGIKRRRWRAPQDGVIRRAFGALLLGDVGRYVF